MGISFNITSNNNSIINTTNYQRANSVKQLDKKTANTTNSSSGTNSDIESERFLNRMKTAQTRLDTLGEYLSTMQDAKKEPGIVNMFQKVSRLAETAKDYQDTKEYKGKKNTDTFISDQINAMNEKMQEIMALREAQTKEEGLLEKDQKAVSIIDDNNTTARENVSDDTTNSKTDTKAASAYNADERFKAAQTYKKFDPSYQVDQILNGYM